MIMPPVGSGDGPGRSSYGGAATTADGTTDDRTPKRTLSVRFARRKHSREREQNDEECKLSHLRVPFLIDRFCCAVPSNGSSLSGDQRRRGAAWRGLRPQAADVPEAAARHC
jgi:hypothetical protein